MKPEPQKELQLLLRWGSEDDRPRLIRAGSGSVLLHIALIVVLVMAPVFEAGIPEQSRQRIVRKITPLVLPPYELTQREPNKGRINREFHADSLAPRPRIFIPPSAAPSTTRPAAPIPAPPALTAEPPQITAQQIPPAGGGLAGLPQAPPPPPAAQEKPKLAFESVGAQGVAGNSSRIAVPSSNLDEAVRGAARAGRAGGVVVGDAGEGIGGLGEGLNLPPLPGRTGSNLELLSDPMGVDFRPYLIRVLASVRRNWFAVMPESVKLGRRGKTVIQFAISREGSVPKLVISVPSGADPLDRAAVAGISASNPFPPLPGNYRGDQIRLQLTFLYNIAR